MGNDESAETPSTSQNLLPEDINDDPNVKKQIIIEGLPKPPANIDSEFFYYMTVKQILSEITDVTSIADVIRLGKRKVLIRLNRKRDRRKILKNAVKLKRIPQWQKLTILPYTPPEKVSHRTLGTVTKKLKIQNWLFFLDILIL